MIYTLVLQPHEAQAVWNGLMNLPAGQVYAVLKTVEAQYSACEAKAQENAKPADPPLPRLVPVPATPPEGGFVN